MLVAGWVWGEGEFPKKQDAHLGSSRGSARAPWRAGGTGRGDKARALADEGTCSCISPASAAVPGHSGPASPRPSVLAWLWHPQHIQCPSSPELYLV